MKGHGGEFLKWNFSEVHGGEIFGIVGVEVMVKGVGRGYNWATAGFEGRDKGLW